MKKSPPRRTSNATARNPIAKIPPVHRHSPITYHLLLIVSQMALKAPARPSHPRLRFCFALPEVGSTFWLVKASKGWLVVGIKSAGKASSAEYLFKIPLGRLVFKIPSSSDWLWYKSSIGFGTNPREASIVELYIYNLLIELLLN